MRAYSIRGDYSTIFLVAYVLLLYVFQMKDKEVLQIYLNLFVAL